MEDNQDFNQLLSQGTEMIKKGKSKEALQFLEQAHQMKPDNIDVGLNLSGAYILTKRFKKAVNVLKPMSDQNPYNSKIWINLGAAYLGNPVLANEENQNQAISAFKHALELDPVAPSVAYNIGLIYRDKHDYRKAEYWFSMAIKHNPHDKDARRLLEKVKIKQSEANDSSG